MKVKNCDDFMGRGISMVRVITSYDTLFYLSTHWTPHPSPHRVLPVESYGGSSFFIGINITTTPNILSILTLDNILNTDYVKPLLLYLTKGYHIWSNNDCGLITKGFMGINTKGFYLKKGVRFVSDLLSITLKQNRILKNRRYYKWHL